MKNTGKIDRILRVVVGLAILAWGAFAWSSTGSFNLLALVGLVPLITGLVGACPLYSILGINTCSIKK